MYSQSFQIAKNFLGKIISVVIDRPLGSKHPKWGFEYPVNYGFIEGVTAPDGEELDAYVLGVNIPIKEFTGKVIAIVHRLDNDDDKLVVAEEGKNFTDEEIEKMVNFQEKWYKHEIIKNLSKIK